MSSQSQNNLQQAYDFLKNADYSSASKEFTKELEKDLENPEILFGVKCTSYWKTSFSELTAFSTLFSKGEQLIAKWKKFLITINQEKSKYEYLVYSVKKGIFTQILGIFQEILSRNEATDKDIVYSRIGICYKQLGEYDVALRFLSEANLISPDKASILAEMADCYALCGEEKTSKVLFREAFFINPKDIDVALLESDLFCRLFTEIQKTVKDPESALQWFPVEGVLRGVLNVKRELRALEVGKLKQNIYALETELKNTGVEPSITIPRLINNYFWLIDHYTTVNEERSKINEILLKIKLLNADVYERYTV